MISFENEVLEVYFKKSLDKMQKDIAKISL